MLIAMGAESEAQEVRFVNKIVECQWRRACFIRVVNEEIGSEDKTIGFRKDIAAL